MHYFCIKFWHFFWGGLQTPPPALRPHYAEIFLSGSATDEPVSSSLSCEVWTCCELDSDDSGDLASDGHGPVTLAGGGRHRSLVDARLCSSWLRLHEQLVRLAILVHRYRYHLFLSTRTQRQHTCRGLRSLTVFTRDSYAKRFLAIVCVCDWVCLCVCLSHSSTVSKRRHLGSRNLYCGLPLMTVVFCDKIS